MFSFLSVLFVLFYSVVRAKGIVIWLQWVSCVGVVVGAGVALGLRVVYGWARRGRVMGCGVFQFAWLVYNQGKAQSRLRRVGGQHELV